MREVLLLRRLTDPLSGALWHAGETASFEDQIAALLVERGIAKWRAPDGPPAHKMVEGAPARKGGRKQ